MRIFLYVYVYVYVKDEFVHKECRFDSIYIIYINNMYPCTIILLLSIDIHFPIKVFHS